MNSAKTRKIAIISTISIVLIIGGGFGAYRYNKLQAYNNLITTANKYMDKGDYDKASALFEKSLQYKNDPGIQKNIQLAKKLKEAKVIYDNGTKLMNDKKYSEAIEEFKKISKDDGNLFNDAQKNMKDCIKQYAAKNIELASSAFKSNKYDEANKYLDEILKTDKNNSEVIKLKNSIATAQKEAVEELRKVSDKYNINQDQALRLFFSAIKNGLFNFVESEDTLVQKQYSLYKILNQRYGSASMDTFMHNQQGLEDQNIEIYVDPPLDGKKPAYFINDIPLYDFTFWANPRMYVFVSGDAKVVLSKSVLEAFDKGNLYTILNGNKVKVTEKPFFNGSWN